MARISRFRWVVTALWAVSAAGIGLVGAAAGPRVLPGPRPSGPAVVAWSSNPLQVTTEPGQSAATDGIFTPTIALNGASLANELGVPGIGADQQHPARCWPRVFP